LRAAATVLPVMANQRQKARQGGAEKRCFFKRKRLVP
jgi:hypothetical protein